MSNYAFEGMSAGHRHDVQKAGVEGETAERLRSRDPRREAVQVLR